MSDLLKIDVRGAEDVVERLQKIGSQEFIDDVLDEAAAILIGRIRERFLSKIDPDGLPWVESKAGARREAHGGPGTGFDSGRLFHSIQEFEAGPNQRAIGTDITSIAGFPYGRVFQEGRTISSKKGNTEQPARIFLGFGEDDQTVADALVNLRIQRIVEGQ